MLLWIIILSWAASFIPSWVFGDVLFPMRRGHCPLTFVSFVLENPQIAKQTDKDQLDLVTGNSYLYENVYKKSISTVTILHKI